MAFSPPAGRPSVTLAAPPTGLRPFKKWTTHALRQIARAVGVNISIDGAESSSTGSDGSMRFKIGAGGAAATNDLALDVSTAGIVKAGTILYEMPKILVGAAWTAIDTVPAPALAITGTGTEYVVVQVTGVFAVVGSVFVRPVFTSITHVRIAVTGTMPGPSDITRTDGVFKFHLATFVNGVKTAQNGHGPITGELCDDLSGTARAQLNLVWTQS